MCGICGFTGLHNQHLLHQMVRLLAHRGPDAEGMYCRNGISLGHRRLRVIDLETGDQPMVALDRYAIVYNGEIYNFVELREELEKSHGVRFHTKSDTEVVLKSYIHYGPECLSHFNGMFAFAVWDQQNDELFLARDRTGEKPLYYCQNGETFLFASELKALLACPSVQRHVNEDVVNGFFTNRYNENSKTIFRDIHKLPPAHYLYLREGRIKLHRYWNVHFSEDPSMSIVDAIEEFSTLMKDSVDRRLRSDVPVGMFLSGGTDSKMICSLIQDLHKKAELHTYSIGFQRAGLSEFPAIDAYLQGSGVQNTQIDVVPQDLNLIPRIVYHLDEPFGDVIVLPTYLLARAAKKDVRVVLTGDGSDELLGGYLHHKALYKLDNFTSTFGRHVTRFMSRLISRTPIGLLNYFFDYPDSMGSHGRARLAQLLSNAGDRQNSYLSFTSLFSSQDREQLCRFPIQEFEMAGQRKLASFFSNGNSFFNALLQREFSSWLPDNILFKQDRITMSESIEARVPFLDHRIVELCARLPLSHKLYKNHTKYLLRCAATSQWPSKHRTPKQAFFMPLSSGYEAQFRMLYRHFLSAKRIGSRHFLNYSFVKRLIDGRRQGSLLLDKQIMALIMFEIWCELFLDNQSYEDVTSQIPEQ
jgi:asparagine synthase (glutamine-hydrolysing)